MPFPFMERCFLQSFAQISSVYLALFQLKCGSLISSATPSQLSASHLPSTALPVARGQCPVFWPPLSGSSFFQRACFSLERFTHCEMNYLTCVLTQEWVFQVEGQCLVSAPPLYSEPGPMPGLQAALTAAPGGRDAHSRPCDHRDVHGPRRTHPLAMGYMAGTIKGGKPGLIYFTICLKSKLF